MSLDTDINNARDNNRYSDRAPETEIETVPLIAAVPTDSEAGRPETKNTTSQCQNSLLAE